MGPSVKAGQEKKGEKRPFEGDEGSGQRSIDIPKIPQYVHYTPLNAP